MTKIFDVAVIGAGAVGSAIARELSRYDLKVALVESNSDVGMGTSKASTAIWHTGYDAKPNSLEAKLLKRSYKLMQEYLPEANIAHELLGGLLIAWNQDQFETLPKLLKQAHDNGEMDVRIISAEEIHQREPHIAKGALGGLFVPGEGILCTFGVPLAFAYQAVLNGVELFLNFQVNGLDTSREDHTGLLDQQGREIKARYIINAAGLYSDEINAHFGKSSFTVTPRRGQLIVYDKMARPLVKHVLLPVPTSITKGVLISPTVYGNILLGPTAEDLPDKSATETTESGLKFLLEKGKQILPQLLDEEVTATYSGLRAATEHSDYQIEMDAAQRYLCLGGIRSTGISGAMGIAEYGVELLSGAGLELKLKDEFRKVKLPSIGEAGIRPHQDAAMIAQNAAYAEIVCHCERVSRAELMDAMRAPIAATSLDALRRRTRASQGRCQGFNCHAALVKTLESGSLLPERNRQVAVGLQLNREVASQRALATTCDVLIVGAGPAGLATAIELKKQGIKNILVVDREPEAGGMPRMCHHTGFGRADLWRMYSGPRYARYYRELAEKHDVEIRTSTTVVGWNTLTPALHPSGTMSRGERGHKMSFTSTGGLGEIEAQAVVLATGVRERPRAARMIPGTRPQGVYTTGSLQRFVYQEHLAVGKRAVIVGAELVSLSALMTLQHAGVQCVMMTTEEKSHQIEFPYIVMKWAVADILTRTPILANTRISNIFGHKRVEAIELTDSNGQTQQVECDTVIFTGNWIPENEMARLGGLSIDPLTRGPKIDASFHSSVSGVFAAGNLLRGVETADHCAIEGMKAGRAIAMYLRKKQG
ncbi:FAD-dependent oxidoreductase [Candidatus Villigracilis saccharophilus]|uniref:FAD-dependent oxidoreductase n=1 Tax=Candidatus Villigracilis saccharophilus TaxID=3140684 RepID=UPI0031367AFC|nr:FAD-dependent oxidoreductase [Anaerolineales bacterium]